MDNRFELCLQLTPTSTAPLHHQQGGYRTTPVRCVQNTSRSHRSARRMYIRWVLLARCAKPHSSAGDGAALVIVRSGHRWLWALLLGRSGPGM
jgi:hypothetical protein